MTPGRRTPIISLKNSCVSLISSSSTRSYAISSQRAQRWTAECNRLQRRCRCTNAVEVDHQGIGGGGDRSVERGFEIASHREVDFAENRQKIDSVEDIIDASQSAIFVLGRFFNRQGGHSRPANASLRACEGASVTVQSGELTKQAPAGCP